MTNWKEEDQKKKKPSKKKEKEKSKENATKTRAEGEWKKVSTVNKAVGKIKASFRRKTSAGSEPRADNSHVANHAPEEPIAEELKEDQTQPEAENAEACADDKEHVENAAGASAPEEKKPEVQQSEPKSKKHGGKHGKSKRKQEKPAIILEKEPKSTVEEDPLAVLKNKVFQVIKNAFSLAYTDEEEIRINVDNIFPLLKALGLNPQSESVVDLVRDACMESAGDIDPGDFESVILALIKEQDDELWVSRLEEKQFLFWEAEAKKEKLEAERQRLEVEREKMGFAKEEDDDRDDWVEYERQKKEEEDKKVREKQEDEMYDNLKMAFRFIDADGDGVISTKDLYTLMMGVGEMLTDDELFGMVNMADVDCDGKVTFRDFKAFLTGIKDDEEETSPTKPQEPVKPTSEGDDVSNDVTTEGGDKPAEAQSGDTPKPPAESAKPEAAPAPELSEEEKEKQQRRRKSMLWGYMSAATKLAQPTKETAPTVEEEPEPESSKEEKTEDIVTVNVTEEPDKPEKTDAQVDDTEKGESGNFLGAIKEEDEHSNYDLEDTNRLGTKSDGKVTNLVENKRKLFSRQSSAASLKNRPNSAITGTESIGDSGIETLDTNFGSEIREQPDVFDISDEESASTKRESKKRSARRRRSKSHQDIYSGNEEDEDMVEPRHVHESLSRVSSMDSLEDDLKDAEEGDITGKESVEDTDERTRNFVEQHMYVEVEPIEEETEETRERLKRAGLIQKAILRRSATTPSMIMYKSKLKRPQTPSTPNASVNGYACSHIDIDLTCESPPKADVKPIKPVERPRARTPRDIVHCPSFDKAVAGHPMKVVEIGDAISSDDTLPPQYDLPRWPTRPLTRPRSPTQKRIASARERTRTDRNPENTPREGGPSTSPQRSPPRVRAQSAVPFLRKDTLRPLTPKRIIKRPLTAQIPYTNSKRLENVRSNFVKNDNITVVTSEPFMNSDQLYPNKTQFTTFHHGFKSIWPIGRKINLIQNKRPFSAFEMNSYSRAIERNEVPFRKTHTTETMDTLPVCEPEIVKPPEPEVRPMPTRKTLIQLELNTDGLKKPTGRAISKLVRTGFTPRSVR